MQVIGKITKNTQIFFAEQKDLKGYVKEVGDRWHLHIAFIPIKGECKEVVDMILPNKVDALRMLTHAIQTAAAVNK